MAINRYDHYGEPRLHVTDTGAYLLRDVLSDDGRFGGVCEYAVYDGDEIRWHVCKEGVDFASIRAFLPANWLKLP